MIVCWNVNSIFSRFDHLVNVIKEHNPKIILLQEIKCIEEKFPYQELSDLGYNITIFGQKTESIDSILHLYRNISSFIPIIKELAQEKNENT